MPPIAPEQRVAADKIQRTGNITPVALCHDEQDIVCHGDANLVEKCTRQIGCAPFAMARIDVKFKKLVPMFVGQISPGYLFDFLCHFRQRGRVPF